MSALSEWNTFSPKVQRTRNSPPPLLYFLAFVSALFIGILIFCYVVTKRAHPVFLDSQGHPTTQGSELHHH